MTFQAYFGYEALLDTVASGAIAPLRARWLIELEACARRQWQVDGRKAGGTAGRGLRRRRQSDVRLD